MKTLDNLIENLEKKLEDFKTADAIELEKELVNLLTVVYGLIREYRYFRETNG